VYVRGPVINALFLTFTTKTVPDELQGQVLGAIVSILDTKIVNVAIETLVLAHEGLTRA